MSKRLFCSFNPNPPEQKRGGEGGYAPPYFEGGVEDDALPHVPEGGGGCRIPKTPLAL